jgi:hypothetical protein
MQRWLRVEGVERPALAVEKPPPTYRAPPTHCGEADQHLGRALLREME